VAGSAWKVFDLDALVEAAGDLPYYEFLRVPALSLGLYRLPAGARDLQAPHDEDEVYYLLRGRARVRLQDQERTVGPGSVLYVRATSEHSFVEIEQDVTLLVFFASGGPGAE
jgi:mannose-6-phosphate isomerase-like protein (cupin superfamily)